MAGDKSDGVPITTSTLLKWGGFIAAIVGGLITLVTYSVSLRADVRNLQERETADYKSLQDKVADSDKMSLSRHSQQQGEIDEHKRRIDNNDKAVNDVTRKLDVAVAILERIEKKLP